jgi:hypothetical protein
MNAVLPIPLTLRRVVGLSFDPGGAIAGPC